MGDRKEFPIYARLIRANWRNPTIFGHSTSDRNRLRPWFHFEKVALQVPYPGLNRGHMKTSATDQIKGKFHEVKGNVKEKAGQIINDPNLEAEGQGEKLAGKIQKKIGQIEKIFDK